MSEAIEPSRSLPIVDVAPLVSTDAPERDVSTVAAAIGRACRDRGFFYVVGHGVEATLGSRLEDLSRAFFAQDLDTKLALDMKQSGRAWRGYFPVGRELTSGKPDQKEGLYFGAELDSVHPRVRAGTPLHGPNVYPDVSGFREVVLEYLAALEGLGHALMEGIALSLGLARSYFYDRYTRDPLILFRIFHYPPLASGTPADQWSVGEHTDYGLLTILRQDEVGGLQVKSAGDWVSAPPIRGSFVCNIGDMLDRMTGGLYRSTPHRVLNVSERGRLSFPFFFDPDWAADVRPIATTAVIDDDRRERWDASSVHEFSGTYGDYLLRKVGRVFPALSDDVL